MTFCAHKTQQDVTNEWNAMAGEWDDMATGYRNVFVKLLWEQTKLDPTQQRTVVDFGCGTGLLTEALRKQSPSSEFICIDAAPAMIRVLQDKIRSSGWDKNVRAHSVALANIDAANEGIRKHLEILKGKVDLVVASSVMSFIPADCLPGTMEVLGGLLKPDTGVFCHSDWPRTTDNDDGFDEEKAAKMYAMAGLNRTASLLTKVKMGKDHEGNVYVGVATKKGS